MQSRLSYMVEGGSVATLILPCLTSKLSVHEAHLQKDSLSSPPAKPPIANPGVARCFRSYAKDHE